jgi:hypothetical protein
VLAILACESNRRSGRFARRFSRGRVGRYLCHRHRQVQRTVHVVPLGDAARVALAFSSPVCVCVSERTMGLLRDLYGTPFPLYLAAFTAVFLVQLRAARLDLNLVRQRLRQRFSETARNLGTATTGASVSTTATPTEAGASVRNPPQASPASQSKKSGSRTAGQFGRVE